MLVPEAVELILEGCILIPQYLNPEDQLSLLTSALSEYTLPPNPLSLSTHYDLPPNLFDLYTRSPATPVQSLFSSLSEEEQREVRVRESSRGARKVKDTESGSVLGYTEILERGKEWDGDVPGSRRGEKSVDELMRELRWANLGWVYRVSHSLKEHDKMARSSGVADNFSCLVDDQVVRFYDR